ncbi:MAG: hypothetical protein E7183_04720 [Erysipelotrichaceae bacterium]|nr:hypothetical protein [Erysipelotrichaceae bacterium]
MSKKRNLLAGLICLILAFVCLVACDGVTESPEVAAKQKAEADAQEVLGKLIWDDEDRVKITGSLFFATQNKNYPGVSISWTSSEEDIISNTGKVNRPESDDERNVLDGEDLYATVIITATVVAEYKWEDNGTQSATTDPISKQFTFTVLAKPEGTDVGTIEDVKARAWNYIYVEQGVDKALVTNSNVTYNVLLSGVVTAKLTAEGATKGFMLHDGTDGIYVYGDNTKVEIGDYVEVIGGVYSYYGSLQVGSNVSVSKSNGKVTLPEYKVVTPQEWEDQNKGLGDDVIGHLGGDLYKVEGYLGYEYNSTTKDEFFITDAYTGEVAWIYYKSYTAEMKTQLEALVGEYVQVAGCGYDRDSRIVKNHLLWNGEVEKVEAPVVDDETKANVALTQITLKDTYDADFDLSDAGTWEVVSGTGIEIVEGVAKVTRTEEDQVVVLKVTVTVGEATASKELTVTIKKIVKETPKHAGTKEDPYTVSDAVLVAGELAADTPTEQVYAVGTIKEITDLSVSYGNATFVITDGVKDIIVFRAKYLNNEKFTAEDQIKVGDVVVIVGQLVNYAGTTLEFNSGCYIDSFVEEPIIVEGPFKTDYAYKFEVVQGNTNKTLYLTGNYKNTYYGESTEDVNAAADVYVVAVDGGYNLKLVQVDGTVLYINVVASGTHINIKFEAAASTVWNYNEELETFTAVVDEIEYYIGTYGTYDTISPSSIDKAASSFVGHLYDVNGGSETPHEHEYVDGKCECGAEDPNYVKPENPTFGVVTEFKENVAYKFGLVQGNTSKTLYLTGNYKNTYYGESTEDLAAAASVYVVAVEGGYNLKLVQVDGTVLYINVVASGTHINIKFEAAASSVWNYNAELETFTTFVNETEYYIGTYGTYDTISPSSIDKAASSFVGHLYGGVAGEVTPHEHEYVDGKCECGAEDPNYVKPSTGECTLAEALELADGTAVIVKGTVVVVEGWNEKYGNMNFTIKDATGELYVYACAYKVVKGDIVTITGVMGSYNGAKQIAKGATCEVTGHDSSYDPAADAVIINFDNTSKRTVYTTSQQVWVENGITVTNDKGASTSNVGDYSNPARFYKSSTLKVESEKAFTTLVFTCGSTSYASALQSSINVEGATVSVNGSVVTITLSAAANSFVIDSLTGGQVRVASIEAK